MGTSTSGDDTRAGARARARPTGDPWADERLEFTTENAPFTFDPGVRTRVVNGCDRRNQVTPR